MEYQDVHNMGVDEGYGDRLVTRANWLRIGTSAFLCLLVASLYLL